MTSQLARVPVKTLVTLGDACVAAGVEAAKKVASVKDCIATTNSGRTDSTLAKRTAVHVQLIALRITWRRRKNSTIDDHTATMVQTQPQRIWNHYCLPITNCSTSRRSFANGETSWMSWEPISKIALHT